MLLPGSQSRFMYCTDCVLEYIMTVLISTAHRNVLSTLAVLLRWAEADHYYGGSIHAHPPPATRAPHESSSCWAMKYDGILGTLDRQDPEVIWKS